MDYVIPGIVACGLNLFLIPIVIGTARRYGWYDEVNDRKIHKGQVPRLGGVGIVWAFFLTMAITVAFNKNLPREAVRYWSVAIAMVLVHLVGLVDDFKNLRAKTKFVAHVAAAVLVIAAGYRFKSIYIPWIGAWDLGLLSYPLTLVWIVGVINALNMIDGMDGLSGGIGLIASLALGMILVSSGQEMPAIIAVVLGGSLLGYLVFNLPPAKTFMGDSGSTFLGFALAVLPLLDTSGRGGLWFWDGITVILLPIYDVFAAMIRRAKSGVSLMSPDRWHFHHKLLSLGFNVKAILSFAYSICLVLCGIAFTSIYFDPLVHVVFVLIGWVGLLIFFAVLHYAKERSLSGRIPDAQSSD